MADASISTNPFEMSEQIVIVGGKEGLDAVEGDVQSTNSHPLECEQQEDVTDADGKDGVTANAQDAAFCPPGQFGVPKLTARFTKMVTGVHNAPVPSGDGKAVEQLNLQDLRDIDKTVLFFKVLVNPAIREACSDLDEREARGFLAADLLGVELVPGAQAPTEAHEVGKQVEDKLCEATEQS